MLEKTGPSLESVYAASDGPGSQALRQLTLALREADMLNDVTLEGV